MGGESALNWQHGAQNGAVSPTPRNPRAEDVLPNHHPAAIHPGGMQLARVIMVPAADLVLHVAPFKPLVAQDAGRVTVVKPLRPRGVMVVDILQRQRVLAFQNDARSGRVETYAQVRSSDA